MQPFLSQISQYIFGVQGTLSPFANGVAGVIDGVSKVATAIGGFRTLGSAGLAIVLFIMARCHMLPRLYKELRSQNSTKTIAELKWIKKKYVEHILCDVNDTYGDEIKASVILQKIRRTEDYIVGIVGKAGLGKSEMLLWLYLKLAKSLHRRCAFIHIGRFSYKKSVRDSIKKQLNTAKKFVPFCRAYIFIDAVDEASELFSVQSFDGDFINELKADVEILHCNIIFSIRDECFQRGVTDIVEKCRTNTSTPSIFKILPMNQTQIKNIYKSFRYAKRIEKRLRKSSRFNLRFQNTLPNTKVRKSIKTFESYIDNHPDTIFMYPVFMRYANKLMEENDGVLDNLSLDNSLKTIGTIVEKMIKWEFHAIKKTQAYFVDGSKKPEYQRFEESIYEMIDLILEDMVSDHEIKRTVDRDTVVIAYNLIFSSNGTEQDNPLQVSHCLFSWDNKETTFEFHNTIFWDYFISKYVYESTVDYKVRKYMFNCVSGNTRLYQSVITVYFQRLYENILSAKATNELLYSSEKKKQISITNITGLRLTEYYKKLPFDDWSFICATGAIFKAETIIDIIENHRLELNAENILGFNRASDISELCTDDEVKTFTHIAFHELNDDNFDISYLFDLPNLQYVTLPPYHTAFLQLDKHNNSGGRELHLWHRTPCDKAESRFCYDRNSKDDIELLEIIFKLEIEETEIMGLSKPECQSTFWTALSLAESYRDKAFHLTQHEQFEVLNGIVSAIKSNKVNKNLYYRYCYDYGRLIISRSKLDRDNGITWLVVPYNSTSDEAFIRFNRYNLGCELVKAYAWNSDIEKGVSVLNDIEKKYKLVKADTDYYKVRCALRLCELKNKYDSPTKSSKKAVSNALLDFSKSKDGKSSIYGRYASEFHMIIGDYKKAKLVLDELGDALSKINMSGEDDEGYQGDWIKYHEMLLLYLYLTGDHRKAIQIADELLEYTHRTEELWLSAYRYVKIKCEAALNSDVDIDETFFEKYDEFRRTSIWM